MTRIALNGLGRIGKLVLRDLIDTGAGGEIVLLSSIRQPLFSVLSTAETKLAMRRLKIRPVAGGERHGTRAHQIAGAGHGALASRAKSLSLDQVLGGVFRDRLWPSR